MRVTSALRTAAPSWGLAILLLAGLGPVAAKDEPTIEATKFDSLPSGLYYFPSSNAVMFQESGDGTVWRSADGGFSWDKPEGVNQDEPIIFVPHDFDPDRAYILTEGKEHWQTKDKGKSWHKFNTGVETSELRKDGWLVFNAGNPDHIIFHGMECESIFCSATVVYTTDGFEKPGKPLRKDAENCWWAKNSESFTTGNKEEDNNRVLCIVNDSFFAGKEDNKLVISDDFFAKKDSGSISEFEPGLNSGESVGGVLNLVTVKNFLLVATTSKNTDEMALFVSQDTHIWHRAVFPSDHTVNQRGYTVLESTNYSIQIDVMSGSRVSQPMGSLFTSNSNGTYFTQSAEHTNRNREGNVDFEKVSAIQGVFIVNQVDNWEDIKDDANKKKKIKTKITFDDGRTFEKITVGDDELHLHSVTELHNLGAVFSSPAPGLVMGNGNTGKELGKYSDSNLYISDDAGRTWVKGPKGPHKYEFGDQGSILVAVEDAEDGAVGEVKYSLDHGLEWKTVALPKDIKITPWVLTTTQDSTSLKFILTGWTGKDKNPDNFYTIAIDFEGLHEKTCGKDDMEDWTARLDKDDKPGCIMGHTQIYQRRKKKAECFIKSEFSLAKPEGKPCTCSDADFECDFNFKRDGKECKPVGPVQAPKDACKSGKEDETFMGSSGWRLIPGDRCERGDGKQKDKEQEWKCSDAQTPPTKPGSGEVDHKLKLFEGDYNGIEKHYLERGESSSSDDETIIARPYKWTAKGIEGFGDIVITHDSGKTWKKPEALKDASVVYIAPHPYVKDMIFFITKKGKVFYSPDRGHGFDSFEPPIPLESMQTGLPLAFHPNRKDWLIWHGEKCTGKDNCHKEAALSTDRGDNWKTIQRYVSRCEFTGNSAYSFRNESQIVCLAHKREDNDNDNPLQLLYSDDVSKYDMKVVLDDVKQFATMAEFILVAAENKTGGTLSAYASVNGRDYAATQFPYNFQIPHTSAYTVLDSSTHAVNLFVLTGSSDGRNFGSILKSNSNGTSYVLSASDVNCDDDFYVDFEKMLGIEGVVVVNTVENPDEDSEQKRLQTKISHNDGSQWDFLPPPAKDNEGKSFSCSSSKGDESCALHIHGYTERIDRAKTYSSESAIGVMCGVGNVGGMLGDPKDADTFMTVDGGLHWRHIKKGRWMWAFGDQGNLVVLAPREKKTNIVSYTTDQGETWTDYKFMDDEVTIADVTTVRSGSSRNFIVWGIKGKELFAVKIDFSGLTDVECKEDDYEVWSPEHPMQPNGCLFGHRNEFLRKKKDRKCYNSKKLKNLYNVENCECTRQDYECDYNFQLDSHQYCKIVEGLEATTLEEYCSANPEATEFYEPSGFRRIPLTTCEGGKEMDKTREARPCPGHEEEFEKAHGVSGVGIFFAVIIPIIIAVGAGWYVRENWRGNFGQIRLGETNTLDQDSPIVKYPVIAVSAAVAVIGAMPLLIGSLWRSVSSALGGLSGRSGRGDYSWLSRGGAQRRFTTRDSFARRGGDYAVVDDVEGELLGDDSDEDV
ncbi:Vacuolar protein sorting/targeting protein VPS10 [Microdochium nivale]|nr:Vacuolar protein sorting/targeting protein VPS10 [Microdochium nivale]